MSLNTTAGDANADSYNTLDEISAYATSHGLTFVTSPSSAGEAAARVAAQWIDARYGARFPGYKTNGRSQSRAWPRTAAYDAEDLLLDSTEIPHEIKDAHAEAAIREYASPGTLAPDLERGGSIKRLKAGSVEIEYGADATSGTVFSTIDGILNSLFGEVVPSYVGRTERG